MDAEGELRAAYRTLDDPVRLLGLSPGAWAGLLVAGGLGYGWVLVSPLGWRASVSVAVVALGAPACLLAMREASTVTPGRLLVGVVRWRLRRPLIMPVDNTRPVRGGAVRLDASPAAIGLLSARQQVAWPEREGVG